MKLLRFSTQFILILSIFCLAAPDAQTPDTTRAHAALADSLRRAEALMGTRYTRMAQSVDSAAPTDTFYPSHLFQSDGAGISELLRSSSFFTTVPYSLSSSLNRALFAGYPVSLAPFWAPSRYSPFSPGYGNGSDSWMLSGVQQLALTPQGSLVPRLYPSGVVVPKTQLFWEGGQNDGVFSEALLRVLFSRPLSERIGFALTSDYRYFRGMDYTHKRDITNLYDALYANNDFVADSGHNPLTREHIVGARIHWSTQSEATGHLDFRYEDLENEISYQDSASGGLKWAPTNRYVHLLDGALQQLALGPLLGDIQLHFGRQIYNQQRLGGPFGRSRSTISGNNITLESTLRIKHHLSGADTASLSYTPALGRRELCDNTTYAALQHRATLAYHKPFTAGPLDATADIAAGALWQSINDSSAHIWHWDANLEAHTGRATVGIFHRRDAYAYSPAYDTSLVVEGNVLDPFSYSGAQASLQWAKATIGAGFTYGSDIDSATLRHSWPNGLPPYQQPRSVLRLNGSIGRFGGVALDGHYLLSDEKPLHKAQFSISYIKRAAAFDRYFHARLALDYWSEREVVSFGGIDDWHHEIYDVQLQTALQIKSFRLFMKVDNLLNRQMAYVPGFYLPGMVFRWGFNWMLKG
jgi:hypothetical protein